MKTADKQKMCSNCHGRIPAESETCLYCGQEQADLTEQETSIQTNLFEHQSLQESLTSLYSPPYGAKRPAFSETQPLVRKPKEPKISFTEEPASVPLDEEEKPSPSFSKGSIWPILLFLLGGNLFTLGLLQLIFSSNSRLTLEWQTDSWYLYCLAAIPMLFVAYRLASKLQR